MSHQYQNGLNEADDAVSEDVPIYQTSPARPSTRGRGRGRATRGGKGRIAKPPPPKPVQGRGRRHKMYESSRAQAAHERMQELKSAFATVAKLVKPVVQEIADRSINELIQDPTAYQKVPEHEVAQGFLRDRLAGTKKNLENQRKIETAFLDELYQAQQHITIDECNRRVSELCEGRYDQLMEELDTLEYLHDNSLPVDLPAKPEMGRQYLLKVISPRQAEWATRGPYVEYRNGVEVPYHGKLVSELMSKGSQLPATSQPKRKADGQPEGQPNAKVAAMAEAGEAVPSMPRHAGGLLAAVEALEERPSTPGESGSNAPTPVPEPADAPSPGNAEQQPPSSEPISSDAQEIPLPRNMTNPDEFGVRIITRKATRLDIPNNRIMVPNTVEWDDLDIGFRDSTNCIQKGATKAKRGKYLGKPGSNYLFIDRRVGSWDSTQAAGEFDEALIKKHGLHPTLGIFLPTSTNEEEAPRPFVAGWQPVALVPPGGEPIHASRTIPAARQDRRVRKLKVRRSIRQAMLELCKQEGIPEEEITPSHELREAHRRKVLEERGIEPSAVVHTEPSPQESNEPAPDKTEVFDNFVEEAIAAASTLEAEEAALAALASRSQQSRPYDAIRDVFTDNAPTPPAASHPAPPPLTSDTQNLSFLADAAGEQQRLDAQNQSGFYHPGEYPGDGARQPTYAHESLAHDSARPNDFLRTALNPPPSEHQEQIAGQEYSGVPIATAGTQGQPGRTPFSNTGAAKSLPALRPMRNILNESPPLPEPHDSPVLHHSMVVTNSGAFFPPAPNRPFHHGYSLQEQAAHQALQPGTQQPQIGGPLQAPPPAGPPLAPYPDRMSPYSLSPPPYQGTAPPPLAPAPLAAAPLQPTLALAPAPIMQQPQPQGPPMQLSIITTAPPAPSASSPRSRPGSSSASSGPALPPSSANSASASGSKYRKLEPAPTPPHRLGHAGNGQELRTVQFDYREAIKDYSAVEAPPRHGPTQIRGWTHNNIKKTKPATPTVVSPVSREAPVALPTSASVAGSAPVLAPAPALVPVPAGGNGNGMSGGTEETP
ncbi:hypothetical protein B0T25DRAFT_589488 [Lasiosphaeria hispida]|uniref:Uncharacterized protein n=1 Tax=Lasiosphaeria hispida TaxID=260671 RepID=A0AAJ0HLM6_9PEZI|nr:hypothetical protein B0T25DRAFT_589488 [Lasiosphaeria hispida]